MGHYQLSVHTGSVDGADAGDQNQAMRRIAELESDMKAAGALVFSGRLADAITATVVRSTDGAITTTDGPYLEAKEHVGGFYVIEAADLDAALAWARRTSEAIARPIEVRPFQAVAKI